MACVIDWGVVWAAVGALATIGTGAAAAVIARQGYLFAKRVGTYEKRARKRRRRAYAIAAHVEIQSIRRRCQASGHFVKDAMRTLDPVALVSSAKMLSAFPSLATSGWLLESPAVGDLPKLTGAAVAKTAALAAEAERLRMLIGVLVTEAKGNDPRLAEGLPGVYSGVDNGMAGLISAAKEAERLLAEHSGLPATQDEDVLGAFLRAESGGQSRSSN